MNLVRALTAVVITGIVAASCGSPSSSSKQPAPSAATSAPPAWAVKVEPLTLPVGAHSTEPQVTVSSRGALLSWVEQGDKAATLNFAERTPTGWSEVKRVASGDNWFLSSADTPTVMRLKDGTLVSNWYL